MNILMTGRCPSARFKKIVDGKPQYGKSAAGLLVLEEADGVYTFSFAEETSNLIKKHSALRRSLRTYSRTR